jgi:hypothetical protein
MAEDEDRVLLEGFSEWLKFLSPIFEGTKEYSWAGPVQEQLWPFFRRGVIQRQIEAMQAIMQMVDGGHGHFGVTFLRPAYEELVWLEYLGKRTNIANDLLLSLMQHELAQNIQAQREYAGMEVMKTLGFTPAAVRAFARADTNALKKLEAIGKKLGWRKTKSVLPSMRFLSKDVNRLDEYKFLYHATSRYVHCSTQEILRRIWGRDGKVAIGSSSFSRYWQDFAMYWSLRIFLQLPWVDLVSNYEIADDKGEEMLKWIQRFSVVPIITMEELIPWPQTQ